MSHPSQKYFSFNHYTLGCSQSGCPRQLSQFTVFLCQALEHEIAIYQDMLKELSESVQNLPLVSSIQSIEVDAPKEQVHSRLQELQELAAARYKPELPLGS